MHSGIGQITGREGRQVSEAALGEAKRAPPGHLHASYRNLGERRKFRIVGPPAQIDFYAPSGLEMVTDCENSH